MKTKKLGGLLNELDMKIKASGMVLEEYERMIRYLEFQNEKMNQTFQSTFNYDWLNLNGYDWQTTDLVNWRQSLVQKICHNNDEIEKYKRNTFRQESVNSFLQKIFFFINKHFKNPFKHTTTKHEQQQH